MLNIVSTAQIQSEKATFRIIVMDVNQEPIVGAVVDITGVGTGTTDVEGVVQFLLKPLGIYDITISTQQLQRMAPTAGYIYVIRVFLNEAPPV